MLIYANKHKKWHSQFQNNVMSKSNQSMCQQNSK